jgi:superfamily II DNA or RNA helicase
MHPAILSGCMKFPLSYIDAEQVKNQVTYTYRPLSLPDDEPDLEVQAWYREGDFLCVPRQYGLQLCNQLQIPYEDETSMGFPAHFPRVPDPREYQEEQIGEIVESFQSYYDFIFRAHTGWGKTVGALIAAARLGRTTLIIVDQDNLKVQWIECLVKLFGFKPEEIGSAQGSKLDYKGKSVCIAMIQTLSRKGMDAFPDEFREYFGFVVVDEVHTSGAPTFSWALMFFSAAYRLGVSATPKRRDELQRAIDHNLGKVRVAADKQHERSAVYVIRHETVYSFYANVSKMTGRIFSEIEEDGPRNMTIAEAALWLYQSGRDVLILSDRIGQLKDIQSLLYYLGVEEEELGLYTGYDPVWRFTKDPKPTGRPDGLHRWKDHEGKWQHAEYCAVNLVQIQKRVPKARYAEIKERCGIVLATYGMFQKGVDFPRLAAGVDASPRGTAEQIHGRILREEEGKKIPIWATIADTNSYRLMFSFASRVKEYLKSNGVLFEWRPDGSVEPCDVADLRAEIFDRVKELKSMQIGTNKDGLHTLTTKAVVKQRKQTAERSIVERFSQAPRLRPQRQ